MQLSLSINLCDYEVDVDPSKPLLWVLREDLKIMGPKFGCGIGVCRSCVVLLDGSVIQSCAYPVELCTGKEITTIEGLTDPLAETIKDAWVHANVSQCGYCQPGQIVSAYALLSDNSAPTDADIDHDMPNLCRCATYQRIRQAIHDAAGNLP